MVRLDATAVRIGSVTLVGAVLENDEPIPRRVRLIDRTGVPVHPPRRNGLPVAGWDEPTVAFDLQPGMTRSIGYATPAKPADPPVAIEAIEPRPSDDAAPAVTHRDNALEATPAGVVRALGDPRPPRAAMAKSQQMEDTGVDRPREPQATVANASAAEGAEEATIEAVPAPDTAPPSAENQTVSRTDSSLDRKDCGPSASERVAVSTPPAPPGREEATTARRRSESTEAGTREEPVPWLRGAERRIDQAEGLAGATDLETAAERVAAAGGLAGVRTLAAELERDASTLEALAQRVDELGDRAAAVEVPVRTFERLA